MQAFIDLDELNKQYDGILLNSQENVNGLYQLIKDVHELFTFYEIEYWIQGGTLLGALRHEGFMWWDDDMDINVPILDIPKILQLQPVFEKLGYLVLMHSNCMMKIGDGKNGYWIDIFPTYHANNKTLYIHHFWKREGEPLYLYDNELYPLKLYKFGPLHLYGPRDPHAYLRCGCGEDYRDRVVMYNHLLPMGASHVTCQFQDLPPRFKQCALPSVALTNRIEMTTLLPLSDHTINIKTSLRL